MVNIHRGYKIYITDNTREGGTDWYVKSINNSVLYESGWAESDEDAVTSAEEFINELIENESK